MPWPTYPPRLDIKGPASPAVKLAPEAWDRRFADLAKPLVASFLRDLFFSDDPQALEEHLERCRSLRVEQIHSFIHDLVTHVYGPNWGVELTVFQKPVWCIRLKKVLVDEDGNTHSGYGDIGYDEIPWRVTETVDDDEVWGLRFMRHDQALAFATDAAGRGPSKRAQALIGHYSKSYDQFDLKEPWT